MEGANARSQYRAAVKLGKKCVAAREKRGLVPYPTVLDEEYGEVMVGGSVEVGTLEVPAELFVGTKSRGRSEAFSADFMPLLSEATEFAGKWMRLYTQLSDEGMRDALECYECRGLMYVAEGNKRLSVLRFNGARTILAHVVRVLTLPSDEPRDALYRDFLRAFKCTGLYQVRFSSVGQFGKLQAALGYEDGHVWSVDDRRRFLAGLARFEQVLAKSRVRKLLLKPCDALLNWLHYYPFEQVKTMSEKELVASIEGLDLELARVQDTGLLPEAVDGSGSLRSLSGKWLAGIKL